MSAQDAERLLEKLNADKAMRGEFEQAGNSGFEKVAKDKGFAVTREEFSDAVRKSVVEKKLLKADNFNVVAGLIVTSVTTIF